MDGPDHLQIQFVAGILLITVGVSHRESLTRKAPYNYVTVGHFRKIDLRNILAYYMVSEIATIGLDSIGIAVIGPDDFMSSHGESQI